MGSVFLEAYFSEGSPEEEVFKEIMTEISFSITGIGDYEDAGLSGLLDRCEDHIKKSTSELISDDWFWRFDPAVDWKILKSETGTFSVLTVEFFLEKDSAMINRICDWMRVCGSNHIDLKPGFDQTEVFFDFKGSLRCLPESRYSFYTVSCTESFDGARNFLKRCHDNGFHAYISKPEYESNITEEELESVIVGRKIEKEALTLVLEILLETMHGVKYIFLQDWKHADKEIVVGAPSEVGLEKGVALDEEFVARVKISSKLEEVHKLIGR